MALNNIEQNIFSAVPEASKIGATSFQPLSTIFHAVNKSGSLAMAEVLLSAYAHEQRRNEFFCSYYDISKETNLNNLFQQFSENQGNGKILISHDLVGKAHLFPKAKFITLLRDPIKRLVSCFYWLRTQHPEVIRGRNILQWAEESGKSHSQIFQFACHSDTRPQLKHEVNKMSNEEIFKIAHCWFEKNVHAYGITEHFEESIMWLASHLGLKSVPLWKTDKRNVNRPLWDQLDDNIISSLEDLFSHDIAFYQSMKNQFLTQTEALSKYPMLLDYKNQCLPQRIEQDSYGATQFKDIEKEIVQQLDKRGLNLPKNSRVSNIRLVTEDLPTWWTEGGNRLYLDANETLGKVPVLTYPSHLPPPKNTLIIALCKQSPPIHLWGESSIIYLSNNISLPQSKINCGNGSLIFLGSLTRSDSNTLLDARNGGAIFVEGDCLIAGGCRFITDDMHAILNADTRQRINNYGGQIVIRKHVWLNMEALLKGGAEIESNCIIGPRALVDNKIPFGSYSTGVPAQTIRSNVTWDPQDLPK